MDPRVGVHERQDIAAGGARAGIARLGDVVRSHCDGQAAARPRDLGGRIRGTIVSDDDLDGFGPAGIGPPGAIDGIEKARQIRLLVAGRMTREYLGTPGTADAFQMPGLRSDRLPLVATASSTSLEIVAQFRIVTESPRALRTASATGLSWNPSGHQK